MKKKIVIAGFVMIMCMSLTGCKSTDYKDAVALEEAGDYTGALELFNGISDYKDAANHISLCKAMLEAIDAYNIAKTEADAKNKELDNAISEAQNLIAEKGTPLDEELIPALESAISETKAAKIEVADMPETAEKILEAADNLNAIDYSDVLENIISSQAALEISIKQYALVDNPTESYIIECLRKVPDVVDISAATEDNDPNGQLNKTGGYTAQVYFSSDLVNQDKVTGSTIIEKGTNGGGSIEVYATSEDALKRNNYLAAYDGTIFASGSHTVIGTVIVRTSDNLTATQQKELEDNIIAVLISLD